MIANPRHGLTTRKSEALFLLESLSYILFGDDFAFFVRPAQKQPQLQKNKLFLKDVLQTRVFCATCVFKISFCHFLGFKPVVGKCFAGVRKHRADFLDPPYCHSKPFSTPRNYQGSFSHVSRNSRNRTQLRMGCSAAQFS